jgi:hypothetical protein
MLAPTDYEITEAPTARENSRFLFVIERLIELRQRGLSAFARVVQPRSGPHASRKTIGGDSARA